MAIVSQQQLSENHWHHNCTAKDNALVYTPNGKACFFCNKTISQANGTPGIANTSGN